MEGGRREEGAFMKDFTLIRHKSNIITFYWPILFVGVTSMQNLYGFRFPASFHQNSALS